MPTATISVLSDPAGGEYALGRVVNALAAAYDFKRSNRPVRLVFRGTGTRWPGVLARPDHPAHALYGAVADTVAGASAGCAAVFGAAHDVRHAGLPAIGDFARVVADRMVKIPDYPGNSMFQTLGNFDLDPRCSLAFVAFERRRILSVTGHAALQFGVEDATHPTSGTGRYWSCTIDRWVEVPFRTAARWTLVERSPFNPA